MLTKGKFLVSFEVPGHTKEYTEGFTEEMVISYRTEELDPYLRYPNQEDKQKPPPLRTHKITNNRYNHNIHYHEHPISPTKGNPISNHNPNPHTK